MFLKLWQLCEVQWFYSSAYCKVNVNSALGQNSKELSSSTILIEASFDDDSNKKTFNINHFCQQ